MGSLYHSERAILEQPHVQCLLDTSSCPALPATLGRIPKPALLVCLSSPLREELGARLLCRKLRGGAGSSGCGAPGWRTGDASNQDSVWEGEEKHHLSWHSGMPGKAEQRWEGEIWRLGYDRELVGKEWRCFGVGWRASCWSGQGERAEMEKGLDQRRLGRVGSSLGTSELK